MKKVYYILLSILLIVQPLNVFAAEKKVVTSVSEVTKDIIDYYFSHMENAIIIDDNGNDITTDFYAVNVGYYENSDYRSIEEYILNRVSSMNCPISYSLERVGYTRTVSDYCVKALTSDSGLYHKILVKYYIGGNYIYDPNTSKILSAYNAAVKSMEIADGNGDAYTFSFNDISANASISSSGYEAIFTGRFTVNSVFQHGGITLYNNYGTCSGTVTVDADGKTTASPKETG